MFLRIFLIYFQGVGLKALNARETSASCASPYMLYCSYAQSSLISKLASWQTRTQSDPFPSTWRHRLFEFPILTSDEESFSLTRRHIPVGLCGRSRIIRRLSVRRRFFALRSLEHPAPWRTLPCRPMRPLPVALSTRLAVLPVDHSGPVLKRSLGPNIDRLLPSCRRFTFLERGFPADRKSFFFLKLMIAVEPRSTGAEPSSLDFGYNLSMLSLASMV